MLRMTGMSWTSSITGCWQTGEMKWSLKKEQQIFLIHSTTGWKTVVKYMVNGFLPIRKWWHRPSGSLKLKRWLFRLDNCCIQLLLHCLPDLIYSLAVGLSINPLRLKDVQQLKRSKMQWRWLKLKSMMKIFMTDGTALKLIDTLISKRWPLQVKLLLQL